MLIYTTTYETSFLMIMLSINNNNNNNYIIILNLMKETQEGCTNKQRH